MSELIPGTALPVNNPGSSPQSEGRGAVGMGAPKSLLEKIADRDQIPAAELLYVDHALRAFANQPKKKRTYWQTVGGQTDATTGNCVVPLFQVPAGMYCGVANVTVDVPDSATITPTAPFANAASWSFIAAGPETSILGASAPAALRRGALAFAPTSAAGPIIPGQWSFSESGAPVAFPGSTIYYVLVGGSVAAIKGLALQVSIRVNLVASD